MRSETCRQPLSSDTHTTYPSFASVQVCRSQPQHWHDMAAVEFIKHLEVTSWETGGWIISDSEQGDTQTKGFDPANQYVSLKITPSKQMWAQNSNKKELAKQ